VLVIVGLLAAALTVTGLVIGGSSGHHSVHPAHTPSQAARSTRRLPRRVGPAISRSRALHASQATKIAATKIASPPAAETTTSTKAKSPTLQTDRQTSTLSD